MQLNKIAAYGLFGTYNITHMKLIYIVCQCGTKSGKKKLFKMQSLFNYVFQNNYRSNFFEYARVKHECFTFEQQVKKVIFVFLADVD